MPDYLTAVPNGLGVSTDTLCDILILIFLPLLNLCHVLPQPAVSNRLFIVLGLLAIFSQSTELYSN